MPRPTPERDAEQQPATAPTPPDIDVSLPENDLPTVSLEELSPALHKAAERAGWPSLVPVQAHAIPYLLEGRDLMVQSRTGSGKTGAFVLPLLDRIDPDLDACQALVMVPTRELASQVAAEAERLTGGEAFRTAAVYGGVGYKGQLDALREGAHLVVGTPGRVLDHLIRRSLDLRDLKILIFDEADRMLSMGFYPDIREIASYLPRRREGYMFSATFPPSVMRLSHQFLDSPGFLSLSQRAIHALETEHVWYEAPAMDKDRALVRVIEVENPDSALIFCNTKMRVNYVATVLQRFGYDADQLTADLPQNKREAVMQRVRRGDLRFLVATDLAGRGIDISELSHVFNYELPDDPEQYVHRTGRTGRAGASGTAISLAAGAERTEVVRLAKRFGIDIQRRELPGEDELRQVVRERLIAHLEAELRGRDKLKVERMARLRAMVVELANDEEGLELLTMVLDDYYQAFQHAPPDLPEEEREQPSEPTRTGGGGGQRRRRRRS